MVVIRPTAQDFSEVNDGSLQLALDKLGMQARTVGRIRQQPDDKFLSTVHNVAMTLRRLKTYAGTQGYVYQYYFVGKRAALADDPEAPATEFVFDVTSDRKMTFAVSIFLPEKSAASWTATHGRLLTEAEQYAAAKLRLFRAFDELENMMASGRRLVIDAAGLEESLATLGVE